jgi:ribosomal protein S12 methylthiotransferase
MPSNHDSVALLTPPNEVAEGVAPKKVGFVSLGCPKNLVDSEVMMGLLAQGGAEITPWAEDADIIVVNTCSFIDKAQQESVDAILEMAQHKVSGKAHDRIVDRCMVHGIRKRSRKIPEVTRWSAPENYSRYSMPQELRPPQTMPGRSSF